MHLHSSNGQAVHGVIGKNFVQEVIRISIHCLIHRYLVVGVIPSNLVKLEWCLEGKIFHSREIADMKSIRTLLVINICKTQPIAK